MILLFGYEKGGTGKSTLATNMAAQAAANGKRVLLADADPQGSAYSWNAERADNPRAKNFKNITSITSVKLEGKIHQQLRSMSKDYDDVIVDTGGRDSEELRSAMGVAHKLIIPTRPNAADAVSLVKMARMCHMAQDFNPDLHAFLVFNQVLATAKNKQSPRVEKFVALLEMEGYSELFSVFNVYDRCVHSRQVFDDAYGAGLGVKEFTPQNADANVEIDRLYKYIFDEG